jgi:hypothetical protein
MDFTDEDVGWFECLISEFEAGNDWDADEDPEAVHEMLSACRTLAEKLRKLLNPKPDVTVPDTAPTYDENDISF